MLWKRELSNYQYYGKRGDKKVLRKYYTMIYVVQCKAYVHVNEFCSASLFISETYNMNAWKKSWPSFNFDGFSDDFGEE